MAYRTDKHNNPTAFTTDIANQGGLILGTDYTIGDPFDNGAYNTAKLLGDPLKLTIQVINRISFYTKAGSIRWVYIGIPQFIWNNLDTETKIKVIQFMYHHEGGTELEKLFA